MFERRKSEVVVDFIFFGFDRFSSLFDFLCRKCPNTRATHSLASDFNRGCISVKTKRDSYSASVAKDREKERKIRNRKRAM